MRRIISVIAIAGVLAACGGGSGGKSDKATVPAYEAGSSVWRVFTTKRNEIAFLDLPSGGVTYALPDRADRPAGYVVKDARGGGKSRIALRVTVDGDGMAEPVNGDLNCTGQLAYAKLYFQRSGDDWLAKNGTEHYRWWYQVPIALKPGTDAVLEASLSITPELWTSIYGASAAGEPEAFARAVENMRWVGITHGGCGAAGHGAYAAEGTVRATIERLEMY